MADSSPTSVHLKPFLQDAAARTDAYLKSYLDTLADCPSVLREAMAYSLFGPGKRIRPALGLLASSACGGNADGDHVMAAGRRHRDGPLLLPHPR